MVRSPTLSDASVAQFKAFKIETNINKRPLSMLPSKRTNQAFTLVEMIFVMALFGIVGIILTSLMVESSKSMRRSINKSLITYDFRKFTGRISQDALNATHAYLYPSFTHESVKNRDNRRLRGSSGDCLVLIRTQPFPGLNNDRVYRRIVVYYLENGDTQNRSVLRTELEFPSPTVPTTDIVEEVLSDQIDNFDPPEQILEISRGLSGGQLFYRATNESFLINGEMTHGKNAQRVINTYNLTISTRG
jgi:prepilin-type N-terminal cleavage/methylation domain-containing protein